MERDVGQVNRIDVLPDDVLLGIFDFHVYASPWDDRNAGTDAWQLLVHVCRRWRNLVFESPRRLNLQLYCTPKTSAKRTLDVWPALPLIVSDDLSFSLDFENVVAILGQNNRVCEVSLLRLANWQLEEVLAAMQVPFPLLTYLRLSPHDETPPVIPDSFLGGSAPHLQWLDLDGIPFPGFPKLLLSTTHLITLWLTNIPHSHYISPETIVALISVLSSLTSFFLEFDFRQPRPDWEIQSLPPLNRSILPALNMFHFRGHTEYLEELVACISAPQLHEMHVTFFNQIDHGCPRLAQFINCTPCLRVLDRAHVQFYDDTASVNLCRFGTSRPGGSGFDDLWLNILCRKPDRQLSSIGQICNPSLHPLSTIADLCIVHPYSELVWKHGSIENTLWLQFLLPFTMVKNLYLSEEYAPPIAAALKELVGSRITEVLPRLQNILVEGLRISGPVPENIEQFAAARQLSGHPIAISGWDKNFYNTKSI